MCAEKGINLSDVWVNIEGFVWSEFVDDISSELYHRYSAIAENIAWEGDVYENKYRHLNIRLTTVDENYDFYEIFLSMEESQNYIEQCVAEGKEKICVIFKLKNVANESIYRLTPVFVRNKYNGDKPNNAARDRYALSLHPIISAKLATTIFT